MGSKPEHAHCHRCGAVARLDYDHRCSVCRGSPLLSGGLACGDALAAVRADLSGRDTAACGDSLEAMRAALSARNSMAVSYTHLTLPTILRV